MSLRFPTQPQLTLPHPRAGGGCSPRQSSVVLTPHCARSARAPPLPEAGLVGLCSPLLPGDAPTVLVASAGPVWSDSRPGKAWQGTRCEERGAGCRGLVWVPTVPLRAGEDLPPGARGQQGGRRGGGVGAEEGTGSSELTRSPCRGPPPSRHCLGIPRSRLGSTLGRWAELSPADDFIGCL